MYKFNSKPKNIFDYRNVSLEGVVEPFQMDEVDYNEELKRIAKTKAVTIDANIIQGGDIVTCSCVSKNKRFNKESTTFKVGLGLYSKDLEAEVIQLKVGDEKIVKVKTDDVKVVIKKVQRNEVPAVNDENVAKWNIDGTKTVEELKKSLYEKMKASYLEDNVEAVAIYVEGRVNEKSTFDLDEEEVAKIYEDGEKMAFDMIVSQGYSPETVTDDEMKAISGRTLKEHMDFLAEITYDSFLSSLIGLKMMEEEGVKMTQAGYEEAINIYCEGLGTDRETAMADLDYRKFALGQGGNYYFEKTIDYAREYLSK